MTEEKKKYKKKKKKTKQKLRQLAIVNLVLLIGIAIVGGLLFARWSRDQNLPDLSKVKAPSWITQDFLDKNPYSRPGEKRREIRDIVIHYVANPGSTASGNRKYFNDLAKQTGTSKTSASSHFIVGLEGEIVQCIPLDEVAYANYPRNADTVSIEVCHPDSTGEFNEATRQSLVKLTAWLGQELDLTERHVIRHYDVIGKNCPKFYVEDEDAWNALKKEIKKTRKES